MPEQQNIEYKQSWHDDYLKWVCGFANNRANECRVQTRLKLCRVQPIGDKVNGIGGVIYIGRDDAGNVLCETL